MIDPVERRRRLYLERMGIDLWLPRDGGRRSSAVTAAAPAGAAEALETAVPAELPTSPEQSGIVVAETPRPAPQPPEQPAGGDVGTLGWDALRERVAGCRACQLCEGRTQTVFGVGDTGSRLMVVGEAPGADEDRQGEPFVGRAGQLLNAMLFAMGWPRERVYIANILKCRPPNNRDPQPHEVAACEPFLLRQLELVQPDLIVAVGRIAAQNLLKTDAPIGKLRGVLHSYGPRATPVVVTYHPAYLLRSPLEKARAWQDLKLARTILRKAGGEGS